MCIHCLYGCYSTLRWSRTNFYYIKSLIIVWGWLAVAPKVKHFCLPNFTPLSGVTLSPAALSKSLTN